MPESGPAGTGFTLGCAAAVGGPSARAGEDEDGVGVGDVDADVDPHAASNAAAVHPDSPNLIQDIVVLHAVPTRAASAVFFSVEQEAGF